MVRRTAGLLVLVVAMASCAGSDGSSELAFCERAVSWMDSFSEDMTFGERGAWAAASTEVREVAPDAIRDDLDVMAALGRSLQDPVISDDGVISAPEVTLADITRAQENIAAEIEDSCSE